MQKVRTIGKEYNSEHTVTSGGQTEKLHQSPETKGNVSGSRKQFIQMVKNDKKNKQIMHDVKLLDIFINWSEKLVNQEPSLGK